MIGSFHLVCYYLFGGNKRDSKNSGDSESLQLEEVYVACINSVLNERQLSIRSVDDLRQGTPLVSLVDVLWPASLCEQKVKESGDQSAENKVKTVLEYLASIGVKHSHTAQSILDGDLKPTLELLWLIFLHLCVHTPKTAPFQRNGNVARRQILNWCRERMPQFTANHLQSLVYNICRDGILIDLISSLCSIKHKTDSIVLLTDCLASVQKDYGVVGSILDVEKVLSGTIDEEILLIYISLLRRKVKAKEAKAISSSTRSVQKPTLVVMRPEPPTRLAWTV